MGLLLAAHAFVLHGVLSLIVYDESGVKDRVARANSANLDTAILRS